jgi:hypothetical protein
MVHHALGVSPLWLEPDASYGARDNIGQMCAENKSYFGLRVDLLAHRALASSN